MQDRAQAAFRFTVDAQHFCLQIRHRGVGNSHAYIQIKKSLQNNFLLLIFWKTTVTFYHRSANGYVLTQWYTVQCTVYTICFRTEALISTWCFVLHQTLKLQTRSSLLQLLVGTKTMASGSGSFAL